MKRLVSMAFVVAVTASAWTAGQAQSPAPIDYDTFCKLPDATAKRTAFFAATPENRGVLVRTQIERWRDANKSRLNEKQLAFAAELLASITADSYADGPKGEEARQKTRPLAEQARQIFSDADNQAMQPTGPCIPKVK